MPTLISLISDQTLPNVLLIKELQGQVNDYVFISTPAMKQRGKTHDIMAAAGLPAAQCRELVIPDENDLQAMEAFLKQEFPEPHGCLVNLTCGTKLMFLACFNHFGKPGNTISYIPIGKNTLVELFPAHCEKAIGYRLSVREYLQAYGISYEPMPEEEFKDPRFLKRILKEYQAADFDPDKVAGMRDNAYKELFTGGWFEQWVYFKTREGWKLNPGFIECRLKINNLPEPQRTGFDNELDIVFTSENELYVVEAKVSIGREKINKTNLDNILFKLSALNKNFGLRSHAWIATLADLQNTMPDFRKDLSRRMTILGIRGIADRAVILSGTGRLFNPGSGKT